MHPYSINSKERVRISWYIALISIILAYLIHQVQISLGIIDTYWIDIPAAPGLYYLLVKFFDKYIWKFPPFHKIGLIKTRNINGTFSGNLSSSIDNFVNQTPYSIIITQTWTSIQITFSTLESVSTSNTAAAEITDEGDFLLIYQYENQPKADALKSMHTHIGTATIHFDSQSNPYYGEYYSGRDRNNFGKLAFV